VTVNNENFLAFEWRTRNINGHRADVRKSLIFNHEANERPYETNLTDDLTFFYKDVALGYVKKGWTETRSDMKRS